jgi:hypothetical protein
MNLPERASLKGGMRAALILLLLCESRQAEGPVTHALRYLARHQSADGSWGHFEPSCTCGAQLPIETPLAIPIDPEFEARFNRLLDELGGDQVRIREEAQRRIQDLGWRAVPLLQKSLRHQEAEVALRSRRALEAIWIKDPEVRRLTRAGAPTPEPEFQVVATSLAVLCFLGAGYTHLSKDQWIDYDGRVFDYGLVVRKASDWLRSRQGARNPLAHAIATTALSEQYGMTASAFLKEPAIHAVTVLKTLSSNDPPFLLWKGVALHSAHLSELPDCSDEACLQTAERLAREDSPATLGAAVVFASCRKQRWDRVQLRLTEFEKTPLSAIEIWMMTNAVTSTETRTSRAESPWIWSILKGLPPAQSLRSDCTRGSWALTEEHREESLVTTLYTTLAMERVYRYTNVLFAPGYGK